MLDISDQKYDWLDELPEIKREEMRQFHREISPCERGQLLLNA